jgi:hypothetical protein
MFEFAGEYENFTNIIFLIVTAYIAMQGIRFRDEEGNTDFVRLYCSCLFFLVLTQDVTGIANFG